MNQKTKLQSNTMDKEIIPTTCRGVSHLSRHVIKVSEEPSLAVRVKVTNRPRRIRNVSKITEAP